MALKFLDYKVRSCEFSLTPDIAANTNYKITPKISCSVRKGEDKLIVNFIIELVQMDEPIPFTFKVDAVGSFTIGEGDEIASCSVRAAEIAFAHVRSSVSQLTQLANVPPYMLPIIDLNELIGRDINRNTSNIIYN